MHLRFIKTWARSLAAAGVLIFAAAAAGQGTQIANDCVVGFGISSGFPLAAAGQSVSFANQRNGCFDWRLVYFVDGFSAISLVVQSAPDNSGAPGSWSTFVGTVIDGINPNTATTFASTRLTGSAPWVRVLLNTATGSGTVTGVFYGCKQPGCSSAELTSSSSSGCAGTVATPCVVGAENSAGAAVTSFVCDKSAAIAITTSGSLQIVPATSGKTVRVCHIDFSLSAASNVTIQSGTGSACGTGTASLSGTYAAVLTFADDFNWWGALAPAVSQAVCLNFVSAVTGGGLVTYAVF